MVKKEDRDESQQKLRVVTKSIELMHYTQQITSNVKVFKPEYGWLTNVILAETINIHRFIYSANEDNLKDEDKPKDKKIKYNGASVAPCSVTKGVKYAVFVLMHLASIENSTLKLAIR